MNEDKVAQPALTKADYMGQSPREAAFKSGVTEAAILTPVLVAFDGAFRLLWEKAFDKIPLKQDTWKRFRKIGWLNGSVTAGIVLYSAIQDAKSAYVKAEIAESQHAQLSFENDMFRKQLNDAKVAPNEIKTIHRLDGVQGKLNNLPHKKSTSHTERVTEQRAAALESTHQIQ